MKKYNLGTPEMLRFVSLVLLNEIINFQHYFKVRPLGGDIYLTTYLDHMHTLGWLRVEGNEYVPTEVGHTELMRLYEKYNEYLKLFDIFCAVDLGSGEFAFAQILEDMPEDEWLDYLNQDRFSDVRVAVADFKGINPIEIVFLSFLNENRFDCTAPNWQFNLTDVSTWQEIEDICNTAIDVDYLRTDGVLEDVIKQGSAMAIDLIKKAEETLDIIEAEEEAEYDEYVEETTETVETVEVVEYVDIVEPPYYDYDYYYPYYDPFYVSPFWLTAAILL